MKKTAYISGPITGTDDYKSRFEKAEYDVFRSGFYAINPVKVAMTLPSSFDREKYLEVDFKLLKLSDAIYLLKGWEKSEGAKAELEYALRNNMHIMLES